jgi:lipid-binding SYLF domain-containing protein
MNHGRGRGRGRGARGGHGAGGGVEEAAPEGPQPNMDMAAILAEMQAMRAEMNAMCQAGAGAAVGAAPIGANDEGGGVAQSRGAPQQYLDLQGWCGISLEQFAGIGTPIKVVD